MDSNDFFAGGKRKFFSTLPDDEAYARARKQSVINPAGRKCDACGAILSRYNEKNTCSPCRWAKTTKSIFD